MAAPNLQKDKKDKKEKPEKIAKKVLAVDDEEEILKVYEMFLTHEGYEVTTVNSAEKCMESLKKEWPSIILLDVNMPGVDGLLLLEMIRASKSGKDVPIVMISAKRDEFTIKEAAALGCDSFIIKPFDLKELARRIAFEVIQIDTEYVINALRMLRLQKNSLLHQPGLTGFDGLLWDCYPFTRDEFEFCIVVPRGLRPQALIKARPEEIKEKVRIYCKRTLRWRNLWP